MAIFYNRQYVVEANNGVKMPSEIINLSKKLKSYKYGYVYQNKLIKGMKGFEEHYKSLTISEFEKYQIGVCWDYVHYEATILKQMNIKFETFYIHVIDENGDYPSHNYLVFYLPGSHKAYYFEASWKQYAGIEKFDNATKLHEEIKKRHIESAECKCDPKTYFRNKYDAESTSWEGLSCYEYLEKLSKK